MHQYIQYVNKYVGLSTDTKPVSSDVREGSDLWEADTGLEFRYSEGVWYNKATPIMGAGGNTVDVQNPFPTDGDSVYAKDLKNSLSNVGTFTGADLTTLFNDLDNSITSTGHASPAWFEFYLERPAKIGAVALVAKTGNFSNVAVTLKDRQGTTIVLIDDSSNDTKYTSHEYAVPGASNVCCIRVEFYTADDITVSFSYIRKALAVSIENIASSVSEVNSTDLPLGIGGVFTGTTENVKDVAVVQIAIYSDAASATDGLDIQFSTDGVNWDHHDYYTIEAGSAEPYTVQPVANYFRIIYTNGGIAQTAFRMQTIFKSIYIKPSSHRVGDVISPEDDAELMKAVLTAQTPAGPFVPIDATNGGNLKIALEEFETETFNLNPLPVAIRASDSPSIDAFGRWRTSELTTLFDSKQVGVGAQLFWDDQQVSGSETTSVYSENKAATIIGVALNTAGKRVRQTKQRFNYQPGKSQLILLTFNINGDGSGLNKCVGYFDDQNGLFFEADNGTYYLVQRSYVTGSAVDTQVAKASWNIDNMDGTGPSGVTIDFTKTQILFIDFEWLGVGRVRMGFVIDGNIYYCHAFNNANNLSVVYMSKPNLPLRYSIENDGTGAASEMDCICSSVASEGGLQKLGMLRSANTGESGVSVTSSNTYAMLGIKLKTTELDITVLIETISIIARTNGDRFKWALLLNPTVAGTFTYTDASATSAVQIATGSNTNTITGGEQILSGFGLDSSVSESAVQNAYKLGSLIDGTRDEMVVVIYNITTSATFDVSLGWRELL